jgi:lon-related putative ATP-dependent protease
MSKKIPVTPLKPEDLRWSVDESTLSFKTTADITPLKQIIGQERAIKSLEFGLDLSDNGYNLYVLGESGTGKITAIKSMLKEKAAAEAVPDDWCYIFNFDEPDKPSALNLPNGTGIELKTDMEHIITAIKRDIPKIFESKDYEQHRDEILDGQQERTKEIFHKLELVVEERGFILKKGAGGLAVLPAKNGKAISQEDYDALSAEERNKVDEDTKFLQGKLGDAIREARTTEKETKERIMALDQEMVQYLINPLIAGISAKYEAFTKITEYLNRVKEDIFFSIEDFRPAEELAIPGLKMPRQEPSFERYSINLIVNNKETLGAPVIDETNPTYTNLFGRIEHRMQYGAAVTDFSMIRAGSSHKANGGYLIIHALDALRNIFVYEALKRMIKNKEVRIEDAMEQYRLVSVTTLKPEPIPVKTKVILVGEPYIYYLLHSLDYEYRKLFKVKVDFDNVMGRNDETIQSYAEFVSARCAEDDLLPFDASAIARVVEYGTRAAGDQRKLTARFNDVANLVTEAAYWAGKDNSDTVTGDHVTKARKEKIYRHSKIEDKLQEYIVDGTIMVDTEGEVVGQINGLAVLSMGDYMFGKPSRITAKTFMGDSGVVNIEREVKMSGRIHSKALLILTSFLGERFAQKFPLTLSASICFEQLYDEVEGDSATCTELYALISSLTSLPIDQSIAVTGSMNQKGEVQPIGGVNEKIEGFFDLCSTVGLTGGQGVIIPAKNVMNLMLKEEVVSAVKDGKFAIYPIETVDQGLEILTGKEAGSLSPGGSYPKGTINYLAMERLKTLATNLKAFGRPKKTKHKEDSNNSSTKK